MWADENNSDGRERPKFMNFWGTNVEYSGCLLITYILY